MVPKVITRYRSLRADFSRNTLVELRNKHRDAEEPLRLWFSQVEKLMWKGPADVRATFGTADFIANNRVIFDIKGNSYRLIAHIRYAPLSLLYIRFIGTHAEYDKINAAKI